MWYMNEERQVLVNAFREFAVNEIRPFVDKWRGKMPSRLTLSASSVN